jgi:plastocyanin
LDRREGGNTTLVTWRTLTSGLAVGAAVLAVAPAAVPATAATTHTVEIRSAGFRPSSLSITEGDTVVWVNRDTKNHQVLENGGRFVSAILRPGQRYTFTFGAAGTYRYRDELYPTHRGTIVVKGAPPSLGLAASTPISTYGDPVTISGWVSNKKAGEAVTIWYRPYPQPNFIQRTTVLTGDGGTYSFIASPQILTTYTASWKGAFSPPASVEVHPRISLGVNNGWVVKVWGGRSFAGRAVQFQRLNPLTGQWVTVRKPLLDRNSSAHIHYQLPKGINRVRAAMSVNQAGAGYLGSFSRVVTWRVR